MTDTSTVIAGNVVFGFNNTSAFIASLKEHAPSAIINDCPNPPAAAVCAVLSWPLHASGFTAQRPTKGSAAGADEAVTALEGTVAPMSCFVDDTDEGERRGGNPQSTSEAHISFDFAVHVLAVEAEFPYHPISARGDRGLSQAGRREVRVRREQPVVVIPESPLPCRTDRGSRRKQRHRVNSRHRQLPNVNQHSPRLHVQVA